MASASVVNVINYICDFFSEITDIPSCADPIINRRMRELMISNSRICHLIDTAVSYILGKMNQDQCNNSFDGTFDHYELEDEDTITDIVIELSVIVSSGWFNYDKYTGQYSNHEIGDLIYSKVQESLSFEAERKNAVIVLNKTEGITYLVNCMKM